MQILCLTLTPQDAELLRAAVPTDERAARQDGLAQNDDLARLALGAVSRAILRQGYVPRVTDGRVLQEAPGTLPSNSVLIQL